MADILIALVQIVIEALIAVVALVVEGVTTIASMFAGGLGLIDFAILIPIFILELCFWILLSVYEFIKSLFKLKKPKRAKWPILWRPKSIKGDSEVSEDNSVSR